MNTRGYQGNVIKSANVFTNDPQQSQTLLRLKAFVLVPIILSHRYVNIYGEAEKTLQKSIELTAGLERPLSLTPERFNLEDKLAYTLEELEKGKRFRIVFQSFPGPPQTYQGYLTLKTNYPEKPMVTIRIRGHIRKGRQG